MRMDSFNSWHDSSRPTSGMSSSTMSGIGSHDGNPIPSNPLADAATAASTAISSIEVPNLQLLNNSTLVTSALSTIGDAQFFEESISPSTVRTQLSVTGDPSNPSTTLNLIKGMKWLLANMSKGRDVSDFFSFVVKLVGSQNLEVKKMVYIYLARYANHDTQCREMALLSINAFQRGLADREPLLRSLALRVLTCLDVPDVLQLQVLGVRTCSKDGSPYVRKCAVNAVGKLHPRCLEMGDEIQAEQLVGIVTNLLEEDGSTMVLTSAMISFCEICPQRLDLLHRCYRKVCHLLTDMDEWGQVVVMDALTRYCRMFFKQPKGQANGSAERIDQERRVFRNTRKQRMVKTQSGGTDGNDRVKSQSGGVSETLPPLANHKPSLASINGSSTHTVQALPPHQTRKVKRRVVRKAFYSDEEDESSEEEVDLYGPTSTANVECSKQDFPFGSIGSRGSGFGFRDDVNATGDRGFCNGINGSPSAGTGEGDLDLEDDDGDLDEDHKLLLQSSLPLLKSRNSAVVLAVCSLHYYCGIASIKIRSALGKALVRIHRGRREIQYIVLVSIRTLVQECPSAFSPFLNDFFVKGMDPSFTRMIKLDILVSLCIDPTAIDAVLTELRLYVRHNDKAFACAAVRAVGKVVELARVVYDRRSENAQLAPDAARADADRIALNCLSGLVTLSEFSRNELVVGECADTIQRVLSQLWSKSDSVGSDGIPPEIYDPACIQERSLKRLLVILIRAFSLYARDADGEKGVKKPIELRTVCVSDSSVSSILWVIGEWFTFPDSDAAPWMIDGSKKSIIRQEILRLLAKSFSDLETNIKMQAVHLAGKVLLLLKSDGSQSLEIQKECAICEFILAMGRVDVLQDISDRSRYESNILSASIGLSHDTSALQPLPDECKLSVPNTKMMLLHRKPTASSLPLDGKEFGSVKNETNLFRFGTLTSIVCHRTTSGSKFSLPQWADSNSSSYLRDTSTLKNEKTDGDGDFYAKTETGAEPGLYSSSSEDDDSSSSEDDESSSSDDGSSSLDGSSSEESGDESSSVTGSDESSDTGANLSDLAQTGTRFKSLMNPTELDRAVIVPSSINDDANESSSDSSDDESDDSSEIDEGDSISNDQLANEKQKKKKVDEKILDVDDMTNLSKGVKNYATQTSDTSSSVVAGLEDLVMTPLVVDKDDPAQLPGMNDESGVWKDFVRPELGGGLYVKMRFLYGRSRSREAQNMGLDHNNPSTVCLSVHLENMRQDAGTLRHVRIVHRGCGSSGVIVPSKVVTPPEITALKNGKVTTVFIGITFSSATDKDGTAVAKFDIKSDRGTNSIEIRPTLGELLVAPEAMSQADFDSEVATLHGIHQRITSTFSLAPADVVNHQYLRTKILQQLNLKQVGKWSDKGCFVGTLPASKHNVYIIIKCNPSTGCGDIVICCNNTMASNNIMNVLKQSFNSIVSKGR